MKLKQIIEALRLIGIVIAFYLVLFTIMLLTFKLFSYSPIIGMVMVFVVLILALAATVEEVR